MDEIEKFQHWQRSTITTDSNLEVLGLLHRIHGQVGRCTREICLRIRCGCFSGCVKEKGFLGCNAPAVRVGWIQFRKLIFEPGSTKEGNCRGMYPRANLFGE